VQILLPINVVQQVVGTVSTMAAPSLLEFLICFFVNLAIQIFDRTYISSNQDFLLNNAYSNSVKLKKAFVWLTGG
jgi:hypothetical protein